MINTSNDKRMWNILLNFKVFFLVRKILNQHL